MNSRALFRRSWLVLAYALTTVLAQGAHRHGPDPDEATTCLASCLDNRPHLSGHAAPDLEHVRHDCLACHFRADHQAGALAARLIRPETVGQVHALRPIEAPRQKSARPSCRAPPRIPVA